MKKQWSEDEEIYLEYYLNGDEKETSYDAAADFLGISNRQAIKKATDLRNKDDSIGYIYKPYSKYEIEYIKKNYKYMEYDDMAKHLNRSVSAVRRKISNLGLTKQKKIRDYDKEIRELAKQGYWQSEIARKLNLKQPSVNRYVLSNNIKCSESDREITQANFRKGNDLRVESLIWKKRNK